MKEQKRAWLQRIQTLEIRSLRLGRTAQICWLLCFAAAAAVIVGVICAIISIFNLHEAGTPAAEILQQGFVWASGLLLLLATGIGLDCFLANPIFDKACRLGQEARDLRAHGWNGR